MEILGWLFLGCLSSVLLVLLQTSLVKKGVVKPDRMDREMIAILITVNVFIFPMITSLFMLKYLSNYVYVLMEKLSNGN